MTKLFYKSTWHTKSVLLMREVLLWINSEVMPEKNKYQSPGCFILTKFIRIKSISDIYIFGPIKTLMSSLQQRKVQGVNFTPSSGDQSKCRLAQVGPELWTGFLLQGSKGASKVQISFCFQFSEVVRTWNHWQEVVSVPLLHLNAKKVQSC